MVSLYKFGALKKVSDPSGFCVKVEAYLKMAELPYETRSGIQYLRRSPKGKLPFIKDDGETIADSSFILEYLEKNHNNILDGHLNDEQKAISHAFVKMMDENLYWTVVYSRWALDHNWVIMKDMFFGSLPFVLKPIVPGIARKGVLKGLKGHGIGRHSEAEITEICAHDLQALSDFLGAKEFFFGDKPSCLDAAAFGHLAQMILVDDFTGPVFDKAKGYKNLVDYTNRISKKYFPEFN
ncbi:hypothetical protein MNBD_ALPHA03-1472 [hydrothermal vent metagenome]|uniref:Glutathione S-transferase n=1 Tax=hydrothermal vent metagenome TaxID=652676 RepID=A0A3B1B676_9ZZZZ